MIKFSFIILFLSLLSSCAFFKKESDTGLSENNQQSFNIIDGVDFREGYWNGPSESKEVKIGQGHLSREFGPQPKSTTSRESRSLKSETKNPVIAIVMTPALNRSLMYLGFLSEIQKQGIKPHIFVSQEHGALLSTFWASELSEHRIEWELFRLFSQIKDEKIYSSSWRDTISEFISKNFEEKKLSFGRQKLIFPIYEWEEQRIHYLSRAPIQSVFNSLYLLNREKDLSSYISLLEWAPLGLEHVQKMGADIVVYLDALTQRVWFEKTDGYILGAYQRAASFMNKSKESIIRDPNSFYINFPVENISLDQTRDFSLIVSKGRDIARKSISEIEGLIEKWKNRDFVD